MSEDTYPTAAIVAVEQFIDMLAKRGIKTAVRQNAFLVLLRMGSVHTPHLAKLLGVSTPAAKEALLYLEYPARLAKREKRGVQRWGVLTDEGREIGLRFGLLKKEGGK